MGFDNDCILNIHSVPPEYFCAVCRTHVYPTEALQAQCGHLYCKPCLVHIANGAQTCPYDGNSVTEAGAKPVAIINKTLVDEIGKTAVRCLYHRSGCMWQGPLSECIVHRSVCAFADSQVICVKCQVQISHSQAEEHAQICNVNVMNREVQQGAKYVWSGVTSGAGVSSDHLNQPLMANSQPQALPAMAMPTSQWSQPQYQQVYAQMRPYSLEAAQPFNQAPFQVYGPPQSQAHAQLQPQSQVVVQQSQVQARPQISFSGQHGPPQYPQAVMPGPNGTQAQLNPQQQIQPASLPHVQIQTHNQLLAHGHMPPQLSSQAPPHAVHGHSQQHMQVPQLQHPHIHQALHVPPQELPHNQHVLRAPPQQHPHNQPLPQAPAQQHSLQIHPSTGFVPPVQVPSQIAQPIVYLRPLEPPQRLPSRGQAPVAKTDPRSQQNLVTCQIQQPLPQQHVQPPQMSAGGTSGLLQGQPHHSGPFADQALGRTTKQQDYKAQSMKNSVMDVNGPGANSNEHKPENGGGDGKDKVVVNINLQPTTNFKPAEHGQFSNPGQVSNLTEHFHPPGPNQTGSFYPQHQLTGPFANHARSFEPQYDGLQRPSIGKHPAAYQMESARHLDQGLPPQQQVCGDSSGAKSAHPSLGGSGSQSSYIRQGFPNAGPHCADGSDSFDNSRKRKKTSMGWCRICNVDCESVQGLEMHGQTREHQWMAMNMVNNIRHTSARIAITPNAHSGLGEASKLGGSGSHG